MKHTRTPRGCVYRPSRGAGKRKSRFYWAKYIDARGKPQRHALKLPTGAGVSDKDVASKMLAGIVKRVERESAGLVDKAIESASVPIRKVLAEALRHLRRRRCSRKYIRQIRVYAKRVIDKSGMVRLADFSAERINQTLNVIEDDGRAARTVNAYREACYAVGAWTVKPGGLLEVNPVDDVETRAGEMTKERRALEAGQAQVLLGVCGRRRAYYLTALFTGYRVSEVKALHWEHVHLSGDRPFVQLPLRETKRRRTRLSQRTMTDTELPLHPDVAAVLAAMKPPDAAPGERVFKSIPKLDTFKRDLERAGIPLADELGRTLDRHALRTTFVSWLGRYGVDPRAQIMLARHTPQGVTLRNYQDFRLFDLWAEICKLPSLLTEPEAMQATGTYDATCGPGVVPLSGSDCRDMALIGEKGRLSQGGRRQHIASGAGAKSMSHSELATTGEANEQIGATGFEPATSASRTQHSSQTELRPAQLRYPVWGFLTVEC